jgi:hypothetical protein
MENAKRRIARATGVLGLLCAATLWAATDAPRGSVVLWSGEDQWVRIERQDDATAPPNDHPVTLGADAVAKALAALRVRPADEKGAQFDRAAFATEELARLAPQIARGLSRAGPRQDVTFSTIGSHPLASYGMLKDPGINTGRVFYQADRLNVIFGELQANYRKKNVYGRRDQEFEPRRVGSRAKASPQKWVIAPSPGIELHAANGGAARSDWVAIDASSAASQPTAAAAASAAPASAAPAAAAQPAAAAAPAVSLAESDLERRLKVLKDLREKGLITEQAYEEKVQQLLSEL